MAMMDPDELCAWLRLLLTPRIGPQSVRRLLATFGSPQAIWQVDVAAWAACLGARDAERLREVPPDWDETCQRTLAWLAEGEGRRQVLTLADAAYPQALLAASDPPIVLFAEGDLRLLDSPAVAVVGSRSPTAQGADNARAFAQALSAVGVCVVSGLARGIDGAAHEGALDGQPPDGSVGLPGLGGTIAVVGTGLDQVYPKAHTALAQRIAARGLLLSEFPLGTPPLPGNFPKRNRIVAALSQGTLVVEAALQSGSLITARLALEAGREVLAIPGSIHSPQSKGCHALIKQGAKLVETAADVLEELHLARHPGASADAPQAVDLRFTTTSPTSSPDPILAAMGHDPVSQEALSARTGLGPAELGARLLELELMGEVARLPGQLFQRLARG